MLRIQENVYMMDEEGNKFMKLMDAEECIACYWVRAVIGLKDGMDQVVGNYFSRFNFIYIFKNCIWRSYNSK